MTFTDGWHVQGLKGTGSYDYNVTDLFVPPRRTFALFTREPLRGSSPAFRMGLMPITAAGHAELGARRRREHARRRPGARRDQDPHGRAHVARQQAELPARPGPPHSPCGGPPGSSSSTPSRPSEAARRATGEPLTATHARRPAASPRSTPPTAAGRSPSGRTSPRARRPSARAAGSSGPSATCTRAPSTPSSARRSRSTRRRCGWASKPTRSGSDRASHREAEPHASQVMAPEEP